MKVAITDASIFIDLYELGGLSWFATLHFEVHTTNLVLNELSEIQLAAVTLVVDEVHELTFADLGTLQIADFPKGLSTADRSLIWYHDKLGMDAVVLFSSDNLIRKWATKRNIEVHGMLWILDEMVAQVHLTSEEAYKLLEKLMQINVWLPPSACKQRLDSWKPAD